MTDDGAGTHPQGPAGPGPRPPYPTKAAYDPESIPGPRPVEPPPPPPPLRAGTTPNPIPPPTAPPRPWRTAVLLAVLRAGELTDDDLFEFADELVGDALLRGAA